MRKISLSLADYLFSPRVQEPLILVKQFGSAGVRAYNV